jgi:ATP-dependent protease ClpP protease subunit
MPALSTRPGPISETTGRNPASIFRAILATIAFALAAVALSVPATALDIPRGELKVGFSNTRPGTMIMTWQGAIVAPMANQIRDAFESRKGQATRLVLRLSSHGGSVAEGERVIEVLRHIKGTHQLDTVVSQGDVCGSMCVFIYVQGQKRFGALTSSWLFHEVAHTDPVSKQTIKLDRAAWERLVDKYFRPAGVSEAWIADLKPRTIESDYWQTGSDLIRSNSGVIHEPIANQTARQVAPGPNPGAAASAQPAKGSPGECRKYFASIGTVVPVPCS